MKKNKLVFKYATDLMIKWGRGEGQFDQDGKVHIKEFLDFSLITIGNQYLGYLWDRNQNKLGQQD